MGLFAKALLVGSALLASTNAMATISQKGSKLFTSDGNQFFIKGVAYQGTPDDPLVDATQCGLDANLMKTLGTNSIRVYHVDPQKNHDACMKIFADIGVYVWLDLDTFSTYILQETPEWTPRQYSAYAEVMDAFVKYENLAGFWVGNEIINTAAGSGSAPFIKAATADMKAYRDSKGYRKVLVGYSAADIAELRPMLQNYLACGSDASQAIDFFGLNSYEWCGTNTYQGSGYPVLQAQAANYSVPIFFSETGCNVGGDRTFADQGAILGPEMVDTWSGTIVYEWVQEANDYGIISYPGGALSGTPTPIAPDFTNLANQWKTLSPTGVKVAAYTPSLSAPACPSSTAGGWLVNGNVALPTLGVKAVTSIPLSTQISITKTPAPTGTTTSLTSTSQASSTLAPSSTVSSTTSSSPSTSSLTQSTSSLTPSTSSQALSSSVLSSSSNPTIGSTSSTTSMITSTSSTSGTGSATAAVTTTSSSTAGVDGRAIATGLGVGGILIAGLQAIL